MDVSIRVVAELDLAAAELPCRGDDVLRYRAALGRGHQSLGSQHAAQASHLGHHVGGGDGDVEVEPPALHLLDEVVDAGRDGPGRFRRLDVRSLTERHHPQGFPGALGQTHRPADRLVRLLRVDPQLDGDVHRLVELRPAALLQELDRLAEVVFLVMVDLGGRGTVTLAFLDHGQPSTLMPIERAVPSTILMAASMLAALRSLILV